MKNTALFNKVLEAMDKGQIVVLKEASGYKILSYTSWSGESIQTSYESIYPEDGATNLYVPTTITPSALA